MKRIIKMFSGLSLVMGGVSGFYWLCQQDPNGPNQIIGALDGFALFCGLVVMCGAGVAIATESFSQSATPLPNKKEQERARFEAWIRFHHSAPEGKRKPSMYEVDLAWESWKASCGLGGEHDR